MMSILDKRSRKGSLEREDTIGITDLVSCAKMHKNNDEEDLKPICVGVHSVSQQEASVIKPDLDCVGFKDCKDTEQEGSPHETGRPCLVFIVEKKVSSGHLNHLKGVAKKKGFSVTSKLR